MVDLRQTHGIHSEGVQGEEGLAEEEDRQTNQAAETAGALSGIATVPPTPRGGFICNYRREKRKR